MIATKRNLSSTFFAQPPESSGTCGIPSDLCAPTCHANPEGSTVNRFSDHSQVVFNSSEVVPYPADPAFSQASSAPSPWTIWETAMQVAIAWSRTMPLGDEHRCHKLGGNGHRLE